MEESTSKRIKYGAVISYIAILISTVAALIYTPWMKNQIGDANYGIYTLVGSLISIFLMDFGLGASVTRFVAKYRAEKDNKSINDVLGYIFKLYIGIDLIIITLLIIVYFFLGKIYIGLSEIEIETLRKVYLIFGTYSVLAFPFAPLAGILNAYERFVELKLCDLFQKIFAIVLTIMALINQKGVEALVAMTAVSGVATIVLKLAIISKGKLAKPNMRVKRPELFKSLVNFSLWAMVLAFAQRMIFNVAPSILGITSNSMEIARFAPASQLEGYFYMFAYAINGLFLPTVARLDTQDNQKEFSQLFIKVGRFQICFLGLLFLGICVVGGDFVEIWMGSEYRVSGFCTVLLILPSVFQYPQQIANTLLSVRNMVRYQAISALIMGCVNVVLGFALSPFWGVIGVSFAICAAYSVNCILLNIVYIKKLELDMRPFYKNVYVRYIPLISASIVISYVLCKYVTVLGYARLGVKTFICTVVYCCIIFSIGFTKKEKQIIFSRIYLKIKK